MDPAEDFVKFAGQWVSGGEDVVSGLDLDGAVAAGDPDEFLNGPAGALLDRAADGQGGEHDGQVPRRVTPSQAWTACNPLT